MSRAPFSLSGAEEPRFTAGFSRCPITQTLLDISIPKRLLALCGERNSTTVRTGWSRSVAVRCWRPHVKPWRPRGRRLPMAPYVPVQGAGSILSILSIPSSA